MKPTGATAEFSQPFKKISQSLIKIIGNLVHPFRNVLFGVGLLFWFFGFFYSLRLKTINTSLTIYAIL